MKFVVIFMLSLVCWAAAQAALLDDKKYEEEVLDERKEDVSERSAAALAAAVSAGELALKIGEKVSSLDGAKQLKDRRRSIEMVIVNETPYTLKFSQEHFDSGTWFSQPDTVVKPGEFTIATVANRQGSWFTGVSGGMSWKIEGTNRYLVLGFTNPYAGSFKTWIGVRGSASAKYGYDQTDNDSLKNFCQEGFSLLAQLKSSTIADRRFMFAIGDC